MDHMTAGKIASGRKPFFCAYARKDKDAMHKLVAAVERARGRTGEIWHDADLEAGERWAEEIRGQILQCDIFLAVISGNFLASPECQKEVEIAVDQHREIIPLALEEIPLHYLDEYHRCPIRTDSEYEEAGRKIASRADKVLEHRVIRGLEKPRGVRIDRETSLASLHAGVQKSRIVVITGAPGIGKTELLREFGSRKDSEFQDLYYRNASDLDWHVRAKQAFKQPQKAPCLILLDSVPGVSTAKRLLKDVPDTARVVIASRREAKHWSGIEVCIELEPPSPEVAVDFLMARANVDERRRCEVSELVDHLSPALPLTLEIAGAALQNGKDVDEYRNDLGAPGPEGCWREALARLEWDRPRAAEYLRLLSLAPRDEIKITNLMRNAFARFRPDLVAEQPQSRRAIERHSLGKYDRDDHFHMHSIVRSVIREELANRSDLELILDTAVQVWGGSDDRAYATYCAGLLCRGYNRKRAFSLLELAFNDANQRDPMKRIYGICLQHQRRLDGEEAQ